MPYCPKHPMAHALAAVEKFCTECGSELEPLVCKCGNSLLAITRYCRRCGRPNPRPWTKEVPSGNAKTRRANQGNAL